MDDKDLCKVRANSHPRTYTYGSVAEHCGISSKFGGAIKRIILHHMRYYKSSVVCAISGKYCMFLHLARVYFQQCHTYVRFLLPVYHNGP